MQNQMPQEIEVWYTIPALRRELAKSMIEDFKLSQKQVSENMNKFDNTLKIRPLFPISQFVLVVTTDNLWVLQHLALP